MKKNFCVFILTHGRPTNVITYLSLKKSGCTYPIYIVVDNEDKTLETYQTMFGRENVIVFNKLEISKTFDTADNFDNRKAIVYARNACWDIAKRLGYKYFIQLDDDYTCFHFRYITQDKLAYKEIKNIDRIFDLFVEFLENTPTTTIAMAQGGDFIGGMENEFVLSEGLKRKAMNSFVCSLDKPFTFVGRINEDVNTYIYQGGLGKLFFTTSLASLVQRQTQTNKGGMTDTYLDGGTYLKSFYTVLFSPSCTRVRMMGANYRRLHHSIEWDNAVPCILEEKWKKN